VRADQGISPGDVIAAEMDSETLPIWLGILEQEARQQLEVKQRRMHRENKIL
jgi:hypothetical protein